MSKQIAVLLDNSGSMFHPVGGGNPNDKIYEAARGAEFFLENLIDRLAEEPGAEFAISIHRFASSYQLLPGGAQIDSSSAGFAGLLGTMRSSIAAIENQAASQAAVGNLTDLYDAVRRVSDFLDNPANQPGFGAPDSKVIFVFTDGLQTIEHGGSLTKAGYEAAESVSFQNLLRARGMKLVAWGSGSDALGEVLAELAGEAIQGGTNPVSDSKVLFPIDETGTFENCTTIIANNAFYIVSNNGILPLAPAGEPPSGLLWEQFSLPYRQVVADVQVLTHVPTQLVNFRDFEVQVDGITRELILGLVTHGPGRPALEATSPSGATFHSSSPGARSFGVANAQALKIPGPEEGTWKVRVIGSRKPFPMVMDLMARGVSREFGLEVEALPRQLAGAGKTTLKAWPRLDGKPAKGEFQAQARVLGGASTELAPAGDGSLAGEVEVSRPGVNIVVVHLKGILKGKSVRRVAFATVQVGRFHDPRLFLEPDTYERGRDYEVDVVADDARFKRSTQIRFGSGVEVLDFTMLNESTARARIRVASDAFLGERTVVSYHPEAESAHPVRVVESDKRGDKTGRIDCLRFDACGKLSGIVLDDGCRVGVACDDARLERLLEMARDRGLQVMVELDERGHLKGVTICR